MGSMTPSNPASDRNEPRTATGRALLETPDVLLMLSDNEIIGLNEGELELQVLAIEQEAATERAIGGLDVERLARAIQAVRDYDDDYEAVEEAELIAAEYARLTPQPGEPSRDE